MPYGEEKGSLTGFTDIDYATILDLDCRPLGKQKSILLTNIAAVASLKYKLLAQYDYDGGQQEILVPEATLTYGQQAKFQYEKAYARLLLQAKSAEVEIENCEDSWAEVDPTTGVTVDVDAADYKVGTKSATFVMGANAVAGLLASEEISSTDTTLNDKYWIYVWAKSSVTRLAGDLQLLLDEHAACVSPLEAINLPILVAGVWQRCKLVMANPATDTAIISVGIKQPTDLGAFNLWLDDVRAVTRTAWQCDYIGYGR